MLQLVVSGNGCVPSYVITIGSPEVTVLYEKWAVHLWNAHSFKSVSGIMKFMSEGQTFLPRFKGACVHIPRRVCCFLPGSGDYISGYYL